MDFSIGVSTPNKSSMIFQDSTRSSGIQQLTFLAFVKVKTDHLVLNSSHQELCWSLWIPEHALHLHHVCGVVGQHGDTSPYLTSQTGLGQSQDTPVKC